MKIEGSDRDSRPAREGVGRLPRSRPSWRKAIPGCEKLEAIGPSEYKATMKVGVAAIKGTFEGKVKLSDLEPPNRYRMAVEGSGGPGFVRGDAGMQLSDVDGGTKVSYDADVQVGGLIASVGPADAGRGHRR